MKPKQIVKKEVRCTCGSRLLIPVGICKVDANDFFRQEFTPTCFICVVCKEMIYVNPTMKGVN
jgi:hypothetical protein